MDILKYFKSLNLISWTHVKAGVWVVMVANFDSLFLTWLVKKKKKKASFEQLLKNKRYVKYFHLNSWEL